MLTWLSTGPVWLAYRVGQCLLHGLRRESYMPPLTSLASIPSGTMSVARSSSPELQATSTLASNLSERFFVQGPADETFARGSSESPCRAVHLLNFPRDGHEPCVLRHWIRCLPTDPLCSLGANKGRVSQWREEQAYERDSAKEGSRPVGESLCSGNRSL